MVETEKTVLVIDPWFEGNAFFNGWTLLDQSFSNQMVVEYLVKSQKNCFIWYSHEHSDHFSTSFLQELKTSGTKCTVLFQRTLDKRVVNYVKNCGFSALSMRSGDDYLIEKDFVISTWSHSLGDSYSLITVGNVSILNLNDCVVNSQTLAEAVRTNIMTKGVTVNILLTQFGYANWVGNEPDVSLRAAASDSKIKEIAVQFCSLAPEVLIPFASFAYFSHQENFYLNDKQNTPEIIRQSDDLALFQDSIFFLAPWQAIDLSQPEDLVAQLRKSSTFAETYWMDKLRSREVGSKSMDRHSIETLQESFRRFQKKIRRNFLLFPEILEKLGKIQSILVDIEDLQIQIRLSYINGLQINETLSDSWDIRLSSEVIKFIFDFDFGYNTVAVNGRFRLGQPNRYEKIWLFFSPQEYLKNGFGMSHPVSSFRFLSRIFREFISKKWN